MIEGDEVKLQAKISQVRSAFSVIERRGTHVIVRPLYLDKLQIVPLQTWHLYIFSYLQLLGLGQIAIRLLLITVILVKSH
jgi:hypothetical protein